MALSQICLSRRAFEHWLRMKLRAACGIFFILFFYSYLDIWPWAFAFTPGILVILILPEVNSARQRTREAQGREKQSYCIGSANCSFALREILQIQIAHTVNTRHKRGYLCGNWQQSRSSELCEIQKSLQVTAVKHHLFPLICYLALDTKTENIIFLTYINNMCSEMQGGRFS